MNYDILCNMIISKIISSNTFYTDKGKYAKSKKRKKWAIVLKSEGETVYFSNNDKIVSNKTNMVILPKGCNYEWICIEGGRYTTVEFDSDITCTDILYFPIKNYEKFLKILKEIEYKMALKEKYYIPECMSLTYEIIVMLVNQSKAYIPSSKKERIQPVIDYIAKNYNKSVSNSDLAGIIGVSTVYFRKMFKEITGLSPITYVHTLRINKAKQMLSCDYSKISDIAYSLGYANIYEFSKTFKKYTGLSPTKYVKNKK